MTVVEQMTEAQERVLTGMEAAQSRIIEMNRRVADAMTDALPSRERLNLDSLPSLPSFITPPEDLPRPEEMIDRYFDFTAKMAKANRKFYKEMVGIWTPGPAEAPKKATAAKAKKSTKARTRKAPAKAAAKSSGKASK